MATVEATVENAAASVPVSAAEPRPAVWREVPAIALLVALSDVTLYRTAGFTGPALWLLVAPLLLWAGVSRPRLSWQSGLLWLMLAATAVRMAWCGAGWIGAGGIGLFFAFAVSLSGRSPWVIRTVRFALESSVAGFSAVRAYGRWGRDWTNRVRGDSGIPLSFAFLSIIMPAVALVVFGAIFIAANPDLFTRVYHGLDELLGRLDRFFRGADEGEVVFWAAVAWVAAGLFILIEKWTVRSSPKVRESKWAIADEPSPLYSAYRNTLAALIGLFSVYLLFEFATLWFREFPKGFHYSGYAHEGAAWLTVALMLATVLLSVIFRGEVFGDPKLPVLKRLAWTWSILNFLLAVAVYHRLFIYIDFNGMTRMRFVGLFGISTVVVGFCLVLWKIQKQRDFAWLVTHQLTAFAVAVYLFAMTPIDTLAMHYNVRRILAGDSAPSVQISVHPISAEGLLVLTPLVKAPDPIVRRGVQALLAEELEQRERAQPVTQQQGWSAYQFADALLLNALTAVQPELPDLADPSRRQASWQAFKDYAYQWY